MAIGDIEHWVVLMMENRSFDHLFGYLPMKGVDNLLGGGKYVCDDPPGDDSYVFASKGQDSDYITKPDPGHGYVDVCDQIFGLGQTSGPATMRGFVQNYREKNGSKSPRDVMRCFRPQDVPVLTTLAQNYVLCDRWFSSVPSSTWPNRYFMHAATSMGLQDLDSDDCLAYMAGTQFTAPTLFGRVNKAGLDWRVYFHNPPHAATLNEIKSTWDGQLDNAHWREFDPGNSLDGFAEDLHNGDLPYYTFIEPQFDPVLPNNPLVPDNSGHPSGDFQRAQELIREVYNAVRGSDLWMSTALIVLFDEHGGFYDHVVPPAVTPDGAKPTGDFKFDRLGPRVPSLVISPWVAKGAVDHGPGANVFYDHTSIAATIIRAIGGTPLTERDKNAKDLNHLFNNDCRHDCISSL
jgi:phospholipase C